MSIISHLVALCDKYDITIDKDGRVWLNSQCAITTKPGAGITTKPGTGITTERD